MSTPQAARTITIATIDRFAPYTSKAPSCHLLMCPPDHYGIRYEINAWMDMDNPADREKACKQWVQLKRRLEMLGASIALLVPGIDPDLVFSANAGLVHGDCFIPSRFRYPERQGEEAQWKAWFRDAGYRLLELPEGLWFEGAGDALFAGDVLFGGHGFRSTRDAYREIGRLLGCPVVPLEIVDERFYHLDTCFCPLDAEQAVYFPGAFSKESQKALREHLLCHAVPEEEAVLFACNAVVIGAHVVHQKGCTRTQAMLENLGFTCHPVDMSEFIKAGGSAKCSTLRLS